MDPCFHTLVQQDIFATVCLEINAMTPHKFINMSYFERRPTVFHDLIRLIDAMGLRHALTLKQDWSHTAILQFYATCFFFGDALTGAATLTWRTHHQTITITY